MADVQQFREKVTIYRKRRDTSAGRPHTQEELAKEIGLSADELGHRLRATGRSRLIKENVLAIVCTLASWETLTWNEAVHLLTLMDYPLDPPDWKRELQRFLASPAFLETPPPGRESISLPVRRRIFQARDLPRSYVARPKAFDAIKHLLLNQQGSQATAITTALRGAGGFGKTTLALALCHDAEIQAAFPDGILWTVLGEHPPRPLDVLNGVLSSLEPSLFGAITPEEARERWRTALQGRVCLLVIDDVWQIGALEPLLEGGPQCVRLITTRNDQVLPEDSAKVWVDAMEPEEAIAVLCRGWPPDEVQQAVYQPRLKELAKRLGYWPLLLTLAHGMLTSFVKRGQTIEKALTTVEKAYQARGVTAFHQENADERQQTADACLQVSLSHLKKITPLHYDAITRYYELAVFPEDIDIPLTTLQTYWQGTGGLEVWEAEDLCTCLDDLSLLLSCDLGKGTIRLHDVFRKYLIARVGKAKAMVLHAQFLEAFQHALGLNRWADLPQHATYLWQHLVFHLCEAGQLDVLKETLSDLGYLVRQVLYGGVSTLQRNLLFASAWPSVHANFPLATDLYRTITHISHLLRRTHTFTEIGSVLLSYLDEELATTKQRRELERELSRPFLKNWNLLPSHAPSSLRLTLPCHRGARQCAMSGDGRVVVSASWDGMLKVWDATTGEERLTLRGHTAFVFDCAMSGDGRVIVIASEDGTLKVWDAPTGEKRLSLAGDGRASRCAVSGDGRVIVSSNDRTLKVWDGISGVERFSLAGHISYINNCAVSGDGRVIVSASEDGTLKVWDATTGAERLSLASNSFGIADCAVSGDGRVIVSASKDARSRCGISPPELSDPLSPAILLLFSTAQ